MYEAHTKVQTTSNVIKEICDNAVRDHRTPEELMSEIKSLCVKCLRPADEIADCDLCNGHTDTTAKTIIDTIK